ncbi:MAG: hypothetical protein RLZZ387_2686 [Chloroflexota bacterium]
MRLTLLLTVAVAAGAWAMLTAVSWAPPNPTRDAALAQWEQRGFTSYRISLRVEALGKICYQDLEVRGKWVRQSIRNTCDSLWLDTLTVDQLFELSDQIEQLPSSRCTPGSQPCPCHRIFTQRGVFYDERLGFPTMLLARSEMQYNWASLDFWRSLAQERDLPSCGSGRRRLTVQVLALTPIE